MTDSSSPQNRYFVSIHDTSRKGGIESFIRGVLPVISEKYELISAEPSRFMNTARGLCGKIIKNTSVRKDFFLFSGVHAALAAYPCLIKNYGLIAYGSEVNFLTKGYRLSFKKLIMRRILRRAEIIFSISGFTKEKLAECGVDPEKIVIIKPGPDAVLKIQGSSEKRKGPVLLTVGRLVRRKGHHTVISALPKIREVYPDIRYVINGDGPERAKLEELCRSSGVSVNVVFTGITDDRETEKLYRDADIFIMPCFQTSDGDVEGLGLVFLEAGRRGLPVIAGDSGGVPDAVEHGVNGLLVEPEKHTATAEAVLKLLSDNDLREKLSEGGVRKSAGFSYTRTAETILEYTP